jgi:hypothetical protein
MALVYEKIVQEDLNVGTGAVNVTAPGGGTLVSTQLGLHSLAVGQVKVSGTWDPASVAAGSKVSTTLTVSGASLGDFALASFSLDVQELTMTADVSATNTVEVVLANLTGSAVNLASGTLSVLVLKSA